jgi:hypothetical protein
MKDLGDFFLHFNGVLSVSLHEIQWGAGLSSVIQKEEEDSQ